MEDADEYYGMKLDHAGSKTYEHISGFALAMVVGAVKATLGASQVQILYQVPAPCGYSTIPWGKRKYFLDFVVLVVFAGGRALAAVVECDEALFLADARVGQGLLKARGYELDVHSWSFDLNTIASRRGRTHTWG